MDLKNLKALDKHTVQVPMTSPYGSFLDQLAYWYYLYIIPTASTRRKPNGTGPFSVPELHPRASAACSPRTRTTGSRACPTSTR